MATLNLACSLFWLDFGTRRCGDRPLVRYACHLVSSLCFVNAVSYLCGLMAAGGGR